jgi:hypothetical protein
MSPSDKPLPSPDNPANRAEIVGCLQGWQQMICGQGVRTLLNDPGLLVRFNALTDAILQWVAHHVRNLDHTPLRRLCQRLNQRVRVDVPAAREQQPILWSGSVDLGTTSPWYPTDGEIEETIHEAVGFCDCVIESLRGQGQAETPSPSATDDPTLGTVFKQGPWDLEEAGFCSYESKSGKIRFALEGKSRRFFARLIRAQGKPVSIRQLAAACDPYNRDIIDEENTMRKRAHEVRKLLREHFGKQFGFILHKDPSSYVLEMPPDPA